MISRVSADYNLKIKYNGFRNEIAKPVFNFTMKSEKEDTTVSYYKDMCKKFPDVAFTLDDASKIMDHGAFYGYDGSMNLVGENYTEPGQKSVRIDVSVIKKMQADPEFEQEMLDRIKEVTRDEVYEDYTKDAADCSLRVGCSMQCIEQYFTMVGDELHYSVSYNEYPTPTQEEDYGVIPGAFIDLPEEDEDLAKTLLDMYDECRG